MDKQLTQYNLPANLNIKTTDQSIEFRPQNPIGRQILSEARIKYPSISIDQLYNNGFIYLIKGGQNQQERIDALLYIIDKAKNIKTASNESSKDIPQFKNGPKIEKNTSKSSLNVIFPKNPEPQNEKYSPNIKLGSLYIKSANDIDNEITVTHQNEKKNIQYNTFNFLSSNNKHEPIVPMQKE